MSELEKANILHSLEENFDVSSELIKELLSQIKDESIKNNYSRIRRGLKTEDNYKAVFSAMSWVKNINGIHQEQERKHKENYQTPDYSLLIENSAHSNFPVLVDVKTVSGAKESCEIMPKQLHALRAYARDHKMPLLIAIYWERLGYWTHTCVKNLGGKKSNKITWKEAISNDISHVMGDHSFLIDKKFYRKTLFVKDRPSNFAGSEKDGYFSEIFAGTDLDGLKVYDIITSSAIDAMFQSSRKSKHETDAGTVVIEEFDVPRIVKISNWLINFVNIWEMNPTVQFGDVRITTAGRVAMVELMKDLGFKATYLIPRDRNEDTERLFKLAYDGTFVMRDYYAQQ